MSNTEVNPGDLVEALWEGVDDTGDRLVVFYDYKWDHLWLCLPEWADEYEHFSIRIGYL